MTNDLDIAIIGGGITGLACAHKIHEANVSGSASVHFALFEASPALGGHIRTDVRDGFVLEKGPDAFLSIKPQALNLIRRLGMEDELTGTRPDCRRTFIVSRGKLRAFPPGFYMIAPSEMIPFALSPIMSPLGKLRMLGDLVLPRRNDGVEESVETFINRRLGREAFRRIAQPMVSGIYAGDPSRLSASLALPQFCEMEKKYGSVMRGMMHRKANPAAKKGAGVRYSLFLALKGGLSRVVKKIGEKLPADSVHLNERVDTVEKDSNGGWRICFEGGRIVRAKSLCLASGARAASRLLQTAAPALAEKTGRIEHESSLIWNAAWRREDIAHPLDGFGFVTPAEEGMPFIACSFSNVKFEGRAPGGTVLLRIFCGGAFGRRYFEMDSQELWAVIEKALTPLLGLRGKPLFREPSYWPLSMPQYYVGHEALVKEIADDAAQLESLKLAGGSFDGVGIPDCIRQGESAADELIELVRDKVVG